METTMQLPAVDAEGYVIDPQDWSEAFAQEFARQFYIWLMSEFFQWWL